MKPTPVQARTLKALNEPYEKDWTRPIIHLNKKYNTEEIYRVRNENIKGQKVRLTTAKVLLRNGWIEKKEPDYNDYVISPEGQNVLEMLSDRDFISKPNNNKPMWSTSDILDALNEKYQRLSEGGYQYSPRWIYFSEIQNYRFASRRVDFWAMACWGSEDYKRVSCEIKVSRADLLHELKDPSKKEFGMSISNEFYFITPPGLMKDEELPDGCGLAELSENGNITIKVKAPWRDPDFVFTFDFIAALGRRVFKKYLIEEAK